MTHLVYIDTATGVVCSEWRGALSGPPTTTAGRTVIDVTEDGKGLGDFADQRWNGTAFIDVPRPAPRVIAPAAFLSRLTPEEEVAIEMVTMTTGTSGERALAAETRVWLRRLTTGRSVTLDDPRVSGQLGRLKAALISSGVWSSATADARIAEILA